MMSVTTNIYVFNVLACLRCLYTGCAKKSSPPPQSLADNSTRFKLILQYFVRVLNVYISIIFAMLYFDMANNKKATVS